MSESLTTNADGRTVLRMERRLAHPPAKVWRALTEPKEFSQWFPVAATSIDLRVGGVIKLDFGTEDVPDDMRDEMPITEVDPPRLLAFDWDGEKLHWELRPTDDGCLLMFTHTLDDRAGAASYASGWHECIEAISTVLRGEPVPDTQPSAELHDGYVDALGLDEGTSEDTADGWRVRYERQLTAPADKVWAILAADAPELGAQAPEAFAAESLPRGPVTTVEAPAVLEYQWLADGRPAGTVRWELSDERGTGHGARLFLTQTGPADALAQRSIALTDWRDRLNQLAKQLR